MRTIDADALKESLKESRDNCSVWLQDCKEVKSQKWIGRAEQALMTFNECLMRIDTIPTIEPGQKTGKWIPISKGQRGYSAGDFQCSDCGKPNKCYHLTAYCPNCGAKMRDTP